MTKFKLILVSMLLLPVFPSALHATSLDEMYRDIVRADNSGYLPMFVKNRALPEIFMEEEILKKLPPETQPNITDPAPEAVNLTNDRLEKEKAAKLALLQWQNAIQAVKENRVTPLVLDEINSRALQNDPKAVEILAFMNTRGIGIDRNYLRAFELYRLAAKLGVAQAADNARKVYRAMNYEQRQILKQKTAVN